MGKARIGRGHYNWRVRLEGGAYVARFRDTERLSEARRDRVRELTALAQVWK